MKSVLQNTGFKLEGKEMKDLQTHLPVTGERSWRLYPRDPVLSSLRAARKETTWKGKLRTDWISGFSCRTMRVANAGDGLIGTIQREEGQWYKTKEKNTVQQLKMWHSTQENLCVFYNGLHNEIWLARPMYWDRIF